MNTNIISNKIVLGTVQFGLDYGINNSRGKIPENEVFEILDEAHGSGIDTLDTADSYGDSERLIGKFTKNKGIEFNVISKMSVSDAAGVTKSVNAALRRLNKKNIYGYMIHHFKDFKKSPDIWNRMVENKSEGVIKKIGFSLYYPSELEYLIENRIKIDIIQVPYSIFDRRFEKYFDILRKMGVEILVRSVFLQGLAFKKPGDLDSHFLKIRDAISELNNIAEGNNIPVSAVCVNFAVLNQNIDRVVVGVDSLDNLREILRFPGYLNVSRKLHKDILKLREDDENIILPINWKISKRN